MLSSNLSAKEALECSNFVLNKSVHAFCLYTLLVFQRLGGLTQAQGPRLPPFKSGPAPERV